MDARDALDLIEPALKGQHGVWADFGAGSGTFTRALAETLDPGSRIYAVDRDASAVRELQGWNEASAPNVVAVQADIARPFVLPGLDGELDGFLIANTLHFIRDAETALGRLVQMLRSGGRAVIIEYDRRSASRWVPYPIPITRLATLATAAGLTMPTVIATRPSEYQAILYSAMADRV